MAKAGYREIKGKRGIFGHIFLWSFIGFDLLMIAWLCLGLGAATNGYQELGAAEQAGVAVGTGIGAVMILVVWAIGDVILGIPVLLTRPSKMLVPLET